MGRFVKLDRAVFFFVIQGNEEAGGVEAEMGGKAVDDSAVKLRWEVIVFQPSNGVDANAHDGCHLCLGQIVASAELTDILAKDVQL